MEIHDLNSLCKKRKTITRVKESWKVKRRFELKWKRNDGWEKKKKIE